MLRGTVIGEGAEIEAGSVVSGEIPPFTVAGGVPARVLRRVGEAPGLPRGERGSAGAGAGSSAWASVVQLTFNLAQAPARMRVPRR